MSKHHVVKSWKHLFRPIKAGKKTHDLRHDTDRGYKTGDTVELREFDIEKGIFTGDSCVVKVTYVTSRDFPCAVSTAVLHSEYCILSIKLLAAEDVQK